MPIRLAGDGGTVAVGRPVGVIGPDGSAEFEVAIVGGAEADTEA